MSGSICSPEAMRRRGPRGARVVPLAALLLLLLLPATPFAQEPAPARGATLRFATMTFVATRNDTNEMIVEADDVLMPPAAETASLEGVHIRMHNPGGEGTSFEMTCDRGELWIESADFRAEGNVQGRTADGRRIFTPWLRYDSDKGIVSTDAAVRILDGSHTLHGRGFRYNVRDGRFLLRGGASVVQE